MRCFTCISYLFEKRKVSSQGPVFLSSAAISIFLYSPHLYDFFYFLGSLFVPLFVRFSFSFPSCFFLIYLFFKNFSPSAVCSSRDGTDEEEEVEEEEIEDGVQDEINGYLLAALDMEDAQKEGTNSEDEEEEEEIEEASAAEETEKEEETEGEAGQENQNNETSSEEQRRFSPKREENKEETEETKEPIGKPPLPKKKPPVVPSVPKAFGVGERDSLALRIEALRMHCEGVLGDEVSSRTRWGKRKRKI